MPTHRRAATLIEVLVSMALLALLAALALSALQSAREAARRIRCESNLRQVGLGMHAYLSSFGCFPPATLPFGGVHPVRRTPPGYTQCFSPFARMLGMLEQASLYNALNFDFEPGFLEGMLVNRSAFATRLEVLLCPSDTLPAGSRIAEVSYRFNLGTNIIHSASALPSPTRRHTGSNGPFLLGKIMTPSQIGDGLSYTAGASERLIGSRLPAPYSRRRDYVLGTLWRVDMSPDDAVSYCRSINGDSGLPRESRSGESWGIFGLHFTAYNHAGRPNRFDETCSLVEYRDDMHSRTMIDGVFPPSSAHGATVNLLMMSGAVRAITNEVALPVWRSLGTRNGGETFPASE